MEDAAIYTSLLLNFLCTISLLAVFLTRVRKQVLGEPSAKTRYSVSVLVTGIGVGVAGYPGLVYLYELAGQAQSLGHGTTLLLALLFNFLLAVIMTVIGRVVLGWKYTQW